MQTKKTFWQTKFEVHLDKVQRAGWNAHNLSKVCGDEKVLGGELNSSKNGQKRKWQPAHPLAALHGNEMMVTCKDKGLRSTAVQEVQECKSKNLAAACFMNG